MIFTEVVLPRWPSIDPIAAYAIFQRAVQHRSLKINFINKDTALSNNDIKVLLQKGILPIGVGKGRTYKDEEDKNDKLDSETAVLVRYLYQAVMIGRDNVLDEFVQMLGKDNLLNKSRLSKSQPFSTGWIAHQAYRFGCDHAEVVRRTAHVVQILLDAAREKIKRGRLDLSIRDGAHHTAAMALLPEGASRTHCGPLTVSRYIRDMFLLGYSDDAMIACVQWFIQIHDKAKMRQATADHMARTGSFDTFQLAGKPKVGLWIESDDPYLMTALARLYDLVVMRSSKGNIIVMTNGFDLSCVAHELARKETCWYYDELRNVLANGTESVHVSPTNLSQQEIEQCISANVV